MTLLRKRYTQTATVWEVDGLDSAGEPSFSSASPRQISVRWETVKQTEQGTTGEQPSTETRVYLLEELNKGDWLFLGTSAASTPFALDGAYEIQDVELVPSIRGDVFERVVTL